jgi:hypothetical protein
MRDRTPLYLRASGRAELELLWACARGSSRAPARGRLSGRLSGIEERVVSGQTVLWMS